MNSTLPSPAGASTAATVACNVRVITSDGGTLSGTFFLLMNGSRVGGIMPIEEILEGPRTFLPIRDESGAKILLSRDAICAVEILSEPVESESLYQAGGSLDFVTLRLDNGEEITGIFQSLVPLESARTSDLFNEGSHFVTVRVGARRVFVAKSHIVQVRF